MAEIKHLFGTIRPHRFTGISPRCDVPSERDSFAKRYQAGIQSLLHRRLLEANLTYLGQRAIDDPSGSYYLFAQMEIGNQLEQPQIAEMDPLWRRVVSGFLQVLIFVERGSKVTLDDISGEIKVFSRENPDEFTLFQFRQKDAEEIWKRINLQMTVLFLTQSSSGLGISRAAT